VGRPRLRSESPRSRSDLGWEHRLSTLVESVAARRAVSLECVADGWEEAHGDVLGLRTRLTVVKSKVSTPGETAALLLRYPRPFAAAEAVGRPVVVDLTATRKVLDVPAVASDIPAVAG
jgi:hypothetical protein